MGIRSGMLAKRPQNTSVKSVREFNKQMLALYPVRILRRLERRLRGLIYHGGVAWVGRHGNLIVIQRAAGKAPPVKPQLFPRPEVQAVVPDPKLRFMAVVKLPPAAILGESESYFGRFVRRDNLKLPQGDGKFSNVPVSRPDSHFGASSSSWAFKTGFGTNAKGIYEPNKLKYS